VGFVGSEGYVILRIVRGVVASGSLPDLGAEFERAYEPAARAASGLVRYHAAIRPEGNDHLLVVVTFWTSAEAAIAAYGGDLDTPTSLAGPPQHATLTDVAYFEVDESQLRRPVNHPELLRLTVGRVAQGIDAGIQQELRARLHELDDTMSEAYVGRRIVGTDVEVAFVSTWSEIPPGRALDQPIWPDISSRYDAFQVETFVPILSGPPA
jgi:hypothetical protein